MFPLGFLVTDGPLPAAVGLCEHLFLSELMTYLLNK
jgi:hypothetical protein